MEPMDKNKQRIDPLDPLTIVIRVGTRAAIIIAVIVAVKLLVTDVIAVKGGQMAPTIIKGDRMLTLRLPYLPLLREIVPVPRGTPVVFSFPFLEKNRGCLRVAAVAGDTVKIDSGVLKSPLTQKKKASPGTIVSSGPLLPPDFSPRDFMPPQVMPLPGTILHLDSLDLPSFFAALSIIRQENPSSACSLDVSLETDGTPSKDIVISDFALYKGSISEVPDSLRYYWFFWDRLKAYLDIGGNGRNQRLVLSFLKDGVKVQTYSVKKRFLFLIADNWTDGNDSRYFGPVIYSRVFGRPLAVLWSLSGDKGFNVKRLGKFIQ
jgi:signal peptidase I